MSHKQYPHILVRLPRVLRSSLFLAAFFLVSFSPGPADAKVCCQLAACRANASSTASSAYDSVKSTLSSLESDIKDKLKELTGRLLPGLAVEESNTKQGVTNTALALTDYEANEKTAVVAADKRFDLLQNVTPAGTTCATASRNEAVSGAMLASSRLGAYKKTGQSTLNTLTNAPGSASEKGTLSAENDLFKRLLNGFCDSSILKISDSDACSLENDRDGKSMAFRYLQPFKVLFGVKDSLISADPKDVENRAARLFSELAGSSPAPDPSRGPSLSSSSGQIRNLTSNSNAAAVALAKGAFDRMVDERVGSDEAGKESVELLRQKAWDNANEFVQHAQDRAGNTQKMNDSDVAQLVSDVNTIYLQLYINLERLAIIKATRVARMVKQASVSAKDPVVPVSFQKE